MTDIISRLFSGPALAERTHLKHVDGASVLSFEDEL